MMTDSFFKKIEISTNDDIEYFRRKLADGLRIPSSKMMHPIEESLTESFIDADNDKKVVLLQSEIENVISKIENKNYNIIDVNENGLDKRYIVFKDDLTYCEFMLLL